MPSEFAKEIAEAKTFNRANYFAPGRGTLVITSAQRVVNRAGVCFIAEMQVVSSTALEPLPPNAPGSVVSEFANFSAPGQREVAPGKVKAFICAALGEDPDAVDAAKLGEMVDRVISPAQPLRGVLVDYSTYRAQTKAQKAVGKSIAEGGASNLYPRYTHVLQTADEVSKRRAMLDAGKTIN